MVASVVLNSLGWASCSLEPSWYALVTRSRHEVQVASQLGARGVEHFLPTYSSVRQWKDRKVRLELPLFPGYIFVRFPIAERMRVLTVSGACRFVTCHGDAAPIDGIEIERLRGGLAAELKFEPHPFLKVGQRVRIKRGPLEGAEGILSRKHHDGLRVVLSLDIIMQSAAVTVSAADIEPV